jgi:hypothetical protein
MTSLAVPCRLPDNAGFVRNVVRPQSLRSAPIAPKSFDQFGYTCSVDPAGCTQCQEFFQIALRDLRGGIFSTLPTVLAARNLSIETTGALRFRLFVPISVLLPRDRSGGRVCLCYYSSLHPPRGFRSSSIPHI